MKTTFKKLAPVLSAAIVAALAGSGVSHAQGLLDDMKAAGTAKIAIATLPTAHLSPEGKPVGYFIDVSREILKALGVDGISATVTTFDAMIPGLQARQFDFIPAGLSITEPRCKVVLFTAPLLVQQDALYTAPGNPEGLSGYAAVAQNKNVKLAILAGSAQEAYAVKSGVERDRLVPVPDIQAGVAAVTGGRAHAFAVGQFTIEQPKEKGVDIIVDGDTPVTGVGFAFRKQEPEARNAFNEALDAMRADGRLEKLYTEAGYNNWPVLKTIPSAADIIPACE